MKQEVVEPEVLTQEDVREILGSRPGSRRWMRSIPYLLKWLRIDKVNQVHRRHCHLRGAAFAGEILRDPLIDVRYTVEGREHLEQLPQGAFITVSNHPFGGLDGIILLDLIGHIRPDYMLMVNDFLCRIGAMKDAFIPVLPPQRHRTDLYHPEHNLSGLLRVRELLSQGRPVGLFPAGGISVWSWKKMGVVEQPWRMRSIKLLSRAKLPVLPIHFKGQNSWLYNFLGMINLKFQVARIPAEIFNKRGRSIEVSVKPIIYPQEWEEIQEPEALCSFFQNKTLL